jgi:23S rRNA (cytidine2498-2'-O)-methyltransferase
MRIDAIVSAQLMVEAAGRLKPHHFAVMTLKLKTKRQRTQIREASKVLQQAYRLRGARKLFHNRSEVTLWLQRR